MSLAPYFLVLTFLNTGAVQKYAFESKEGCNAIKPAVMQLYSDMETKVSIECIKRMDIDPKEQVSPTRSREIIRYKETYKIRTSYKF